MLVLIILSSLKTKYVIYFELKLRSFFKTFHIFHMIIVTIKRLKILYFFNIIKKTNL